MVLRTDGLARHSCGNLENGIRQYMYSGSMGMLRPKQKRDLDILCTLRTEGPTNSVRKDVVRWTQMFVSNRRRQGRADVKSLITTTIGAGGPGIIWSHKKYDPYFDALGRAKIVVT